jgi:hypothetical protein
VRGGGGEAMEWGAIGPSANVKWRIRQKMACEGGGAMSAENWRFLMKVNWRSKCGGGWQIG